VFRPFDTPTRRHLLVPVRAQQGGGCGDHPGIRGDRRGHRLRNVYKPTNVIANTLKRALEGRTSCCSRRRRSRTRCSNSSPREHHRRSQLRRLEELPRTVRNSARSRCSRRSGRLRHSAIERCAPGHRLRSLHAAHRSSRSSRRRRAKTALRPRLGISAASNLRRFGQPAIADDVGASQAARFIDLRHRERTLEHRQAPPSATRRARARALRRRPWARTTRRSPRPPRSGRRRAAAPLSADDRAAIEAEMPTRRVRAPRHLDRAQRKGKALLSALHVAFAKAKELRCAAEGDRLHESRKTQTISSACWRHPWKDASSSSTAPTRRAVQGDLRGLAGAAPRRRSRHRLAQRDIRSHSSIFP